MPSKQSEEDDVATAILKREVFLAADGLLSRGIRPTLVLIEAEVSGPKQSLDRLLRDWAAGLAPDANYYADPLLLVDRTRDPLIEVRNTVSARLSAATQRELTRKRSDIEDLTREVTRARERLQKLESSPTKPGREIQPATLEKARLRLAALEERLASLGQPDPAG